MKIRIYAENMSGEKREIGTCVTDSPNRALQMYEGELQDRERLVWAHVDPIND